MGEPTQIKLKDNKCAIVMNTETWAVEFYFPKYEEEEMVPYSVVVLSVVAGMLNKQEPEFMTYIEKVVDTVMYEMKKGDVE